MRTRSEMPTCNMAHHKIEGNKLMHKFSNKQNLDNIKKDLQRICNSNYPNGISLYMKQKKK